MAARRRWPDGSEATQPIWLCEAAHDKMAARRGGDGQRGDATLASEWSDTGRLTAKHFEEKKWGRPTNQFARTYSLYSQHQLPHSTLCLTSPALPARLARTYSLSVTKSLASLL